MAERPCLRVDEWVFRRLNARRNSSGNVLKTAGMNPLHDDDVTMKRAGDLTLRIRAVLAVERHDDACAWDFLKV